MEIFFSIINTILLAALFIYQRQKNRVLSDALKAQSRLVEETKSVVTQQSAAIESQSKVVETALKYTAAFDPSKLEEMVRRELTIDHREHLEGLQNDFDRQLLEVQQSAQQHLRETVSSLLDSVRSTAATVLTGHIKPMVPIILDALLRMEAGERESVLATFDPTVAGEFRVGLDIVRREIAEHAVNASEMS